MEKRRHANNARLSRVEVSNHSTQRFLGRLKFRGGMFRELAAGVKRNCQEKLTRERAQGPQKGPLAGTLAAPARAESRHAATMRDVRRATGSTSSERLRVAPDR